VPGIGVRVASNHWGLAIESHAANHPDTDHIQADLSQIDPRLFPRTDLMWASPSCTAHSAAQGKKRLDLQQPDLFGDILPEEAAERSRATMWDVVRFSEHHQYQAVIVENVVEVAQWPPFRAWLLAMDSIGYAHRIVYLNSMHAQLFGAGDPQSRDRIYIVLWRRRNRAVDVDRVVSPRAMCPDHGGVDARQAWKKSRQWGRYRAQYVYICGRVGCRHVVEPFYRPAVDAIDWTLQGQRIGDRNRPLAPKTLARIRAGVEKYWAPLVVPIEGRAGVATARSVDQAVRTMTSRNETGLALPTFVTQFRDRVRDLDPFYEPLNTVVADGPNHAVVNAPAFVAELRGGGNMHRPVTEPLATVTAAGNHHGLVTTYYGSGSTKPTAEPLSTVTSMDRHALLMRNNTARGNQAQITTPVTEYARTVTTAGHQSLLTGATIDLYDVLFRMLEPHEIAAAMDFPTGYVLKGNKRERVRQAGAAVTPPCSRDLIGVVAESLGAVS
jgi:DNA (cytosine-5)-methyltransferase 1